MNVAELDEYRAWVERHWAVAIDASHALEHEAFDPARPVADPAAALGLLEERDPARGLSSDHTTLFVGNSLRREAEHFRGRVVWEVGCGTGVLSALAGRLGARRVLATDIDPGAVELARRTGERNAVRVETAVANLYEGSPWTDPADVVIADLPQKPVSGGSLPLGQDGGPEGMRCLLPFLEETPRRLAAEGRLYFFAHSLTHPAALVRLHQLFRPRLLAFMWRVFSRESLRGIFPYLVERRSRNLCRFWDLPDGRHAFISMNFAASPVRAGGGVRRLAPGVGERAGA